MNTNQSSRASSVTARQMAHFVQRAIDADAPLLASLLYRYAEAERLSWAELAASLACTEDALNTIAMCRPPRNDSFIIDVTAIADGQIETGKLVELLRRIQVLQSFQTPPPTVQHSAAQATGMLLAAMDREAADKIGPTGDE